MLLITAVATFLYGRKIDGGHVATGSHEDVQAKEVAAFDLAPEELHHRDDPNGSSTTPREKTR